MALMCETCKCSMWIDHDKGGYKTDCDCNCADHLKGNCQLCGGKIEDNKGLDVAPFGATCADCVKEMKIQITCDICGVKSSDYSKGSFWNCLCQTCWNKEKDLI